MITQNMWIAYQFDIGANRAMLVLGSLKTRSGLEDDAKPQLICVEWPVVPSRGAPAAIGVEKALGLSGLGALYREAWSQFADDPEVSAEFLLRLDNAFERVLADLLSDMIWRELTSHALQRAGLSGDERAVAVVVQGPLFPKLLGRLAYRRVGEVCPHSDIIFATFRRRFLLQHPAVTTTDRTASIAGDTMLLGPFPDENEDSMLYRYYLNVVPGDGGEEEGLPLLLEVLTQRPGDRAGASRRALEAFLGQPGVGQVNARGIRLERANWRYVPPADEPAQQRVLIPAPLARLREACGQRMRQVLGRTFTLTNVISFPERADEIRPLRALLAVAEHNGWDYPVIRRLWNSAAMGEPLPDTEEAWASRRREVETSRYQGTFGFIPPEE